MGELRLCKKVISKHHTIYSKNAITFKNGICELGHWKVAQNILVFFWSSTCEQCYFQRKGSVSIVCEFKGNMAL